MRTEAFALTVLVSPKPGAPENTYSNRWTEALRSLGVEVNGLSLTNVLRHRRAVVHVHWPEHLISDPIRHRRIAKSTRSFATLAALSVLRRPLVWTAHNAQPHSLELKGRQRLVLSWIHHLASGVVVTSEDHIELLQNLYPDLAGVRFEVIPLGSLVPEGGDPTAHSDIDEGSVPVLLQFGIIAPYKEQLETLLNLRPLLVAGEVKLKIVGRVGDEKYASNLRSEANALDGVELVERHVPDPELSNLIASSTASLALQRRPLNSGVIPASIPLGTPVISANTAQARDCLDIVGDDWIRLVDDRTRATEWRKILEWANRPRSSSGESFFRWEDNARQHLEFYQDLLNSVRR